MQSVTKIHHNVHIDGLGIHRPRRDDVLSNEPPFRASVRCDEPVPHRTARLFAIWRTGGGVAAANALRYMEVK